MDGLGVLLLLILIAALPVFLLYLWFRLSRFPLSLPWFLFLLLAGVFSLLVALVLQRLLPDVPKGAGGTGWVLYAIFCRVALAEEAGRFLIFLALFRMGFVQRLTRRAQGSFPEGKGEPGFWGAIIGLVAGLGFAAIENASYGTADIGIAFIRAFTAAPLHGACGARVGAAAADLRKAPLPSLSRFLSAVAIHGMYNFMILLRGVPWILAILVAFSALVSAILFIRAGLSKA